jgi:NAD(P)-dependent dehydrogenase (short-subunit alcohol dehydrogenase family)
MILDQLHLDGRMALITGGSQGLGLGMARALRQAGAAVAIAARNQERLETARQQIGGDMSQVRAYAADISDVQTAQGLVRQVYEDFGRLDVLVTAAAAQVRKPALEVTPEDWDHLVAINLRAVFFTCQEAARCMVEQREKGQHGSVGKIITIASITAVGAWPDVSVYGATKGGVVQMTKSLALEWGPLGICANAIGPGTFHTELTESLYADRERAGRITSRIPLGRPGVPDDLAGAVVFLASPASDYVTGQVLWVDGGFLVIGAGL